MEYPDMKKERLYESETATFPREALNAEKNRTIWSRIWNYAENMLGRRDLNSGAGRYSSRNQCLIHNFEREENVASAEHVL